MIEIIPNWHPLFVHFTVALVTLSGVFFVGAKLFVNREFSEELLTVARWLLWCGGIFTLATVTAGFLAYYSVAHDSPSHIAMTTHRNWALVTALGIFICFGWSIIHFRRRIKPPFTFIVSIIVVIILLATTAWHGGELVYRYGIGVMSLPTSTESGHAHEHGNDHTSSNSTKHHKQRDKKNDSHDDVHSH